DAPGSTERCVAAGERELPVIARRHAMEQAGPVALQQLRLALPCPEIGGARHPWQADRRLRRAALYRDLARQVRQHEIAAIPVGEEGECVVSRDERGLAHPDVLAAPLAVMPKRRIERFHAALAEAGDDGLREVAQEQELLQRHILHGGDDALAADDVLAQTHGTLLSCARPNSPEPF